MRAKKKRQPRGVVDTSVLVAGIAAFRRTEASPANPSASLIREWITDATFVWLVSNDILREYKTVLARLRVAPAVIGRAINLISDGAERVPVSLARSISPDPGDEPFCACAEQGNADFIVTLNRKDFPQPLLSAHVISPGDRIPTTARKKKPQTAR